MVWGCFSSKGTSELAILIGKQDSNKYMDTISDYLEPFAQYHYGLEYIFQQDNATIHTSNATTAFFADKNITVMDWPSKSPDLNPIENL